MYVTSLHLLQSARFRQRRICHALLLISGCARSHVTCLPIDLSQHHSGVPVTSTTNDMAFQDVYLSITNSHLLHADRPGQQGGRDQPAPYHLNADHIRADLTSGGDGERPNWPLSCYGPGRDAPRQLLEGAVEQSPEECRVLYHQAVAAGMVGEYVSLLMSRWRDA